MQNRFAARLGGAVLLAALAVLGGPPAATRAAEEAPAPCCFTNPRYSGVCEVQPAKGETCASVLDYLNNANASGKTYCQNTEVRGGWAEAKCKPPKEEKPASR